MKIEEEIKQSKFDSELHKLAVNLIFTGNWLGLVTAQFLKRFDLTPQQFNVLRILRGQHPNPATVNLLIERMLDRMSNVSRIVDKLFAKGLVERKTCKKDRRAVDIIITEKGLSLLSEIDSRREEMDSVLNKLSEAEAKQLNGLLDKVRG
jgi:DNA-binding MarR family transcriptional regulator